MKTKVVRAWAYLDEDSQIDLDCLYKKDPKPIMSTDIPFIEVEIRPVKKSRKGL